MVPGPRSVTALCSGNPSVSSKPEQLVTHINLVFWNHPHAKSLPSFLEHGLFAYAGLEAGPSPNQNRDVILQEKGQLAPWPGLIGSLPRLPQAPGSSPFLGESL